MRRAFSAVAAGVLLGAASLPAALFAGLPASASSASVVIGITGISPDTAALGETITISGTVANHSGQSLVSPKVEFLVSRVPVGDVKTVSADLSATAAVGTIPVPGSAIQPAAQIPPGSSSRWSITIPTSRLGFTVFGAYPVTAQVTEGGTVLADVNSFLPYTPPRHGRFASPRPRPDQIAWVLPLIDRALTGMPGVQQCQTSKAGRLAASLSPAGRLGRLLSAGTTGHARRDQVTWAVDPALLWDAGELSSGPCWAVRPHQAAAAASWLRRVRADTAKQSLFTTAYANISLALISERRAPDVQNAILDGRAVGGAARLLNRNLTPEPTGPEGQAAGTLWPPDGIASQSTISALAPSAGVSTILLSNSQAHGAATAARMPSDSGGYVRVLRYDDALTQLLARAPAVPGQRFGIDQAFLAATAVLAASGQPILVAPPQLWNASGRLITDLFTETAKASWLTPVSIATMAAGARPVGLQLPPASAERPGLSPAVLKKLGALSHDINQLSNLHAARHYLDLQLALYALESASLRLGRNEQLRQLAALDSAVNGQLRQVGLEVKGPVILGGLKGNVPLVINNPLDFPVKVRLVATVSQPQGGGFVVQEAIKGLVVVPAHHRLPTSLHVQATQAGAARIYLHLVNDRNQALPGQYASVSVHATQFGTLAMIILASALGVFTIASAARGLRRRPPAPDNSPDDGHPDPDEVQAGQIAAEPDTVVPEHSELGAAGPSGL